MSKDAAVNDEVEQTTAAESAPVGKPSVSSDDLDKQLDNIAEEIEADDPKATESEDDATDVEEPKADETKEESEQPGDKPEGEQPLTEKSQNRFQQLANDNRELRKQIEELQAKQAQFATEQDLLNEVNPETGDYYTPQEIERISWAQQREKLNERTGQELYDLQVRQNQQAISSEAQQVVSEIPLLNPESKDYVPEVGEQYANLLNDNLVYQTADGQQVNRSTLLANGVNPDTQATLVGYYTSPFKIAQTLSVAYQTAQKRGETVGQAKAQKATAKMLANADAPSSAGPVSKPGEEDPILEGFNSPY
jgi:hypothetical protein